MWCRHWKAQVEMNVELQVLTLLDQVLSLGGRSASFSRSTPLLGAIPELDSMAVVSLISAIEDGFGIAIDDDDIDGETFATVGTLVEFVTERIG